MTRPLASNSCLHLPGTGLQALLYGSGDPNSGPHGCIAYSLLIKPISHPWIFIYSDKNVSKKKKKTGTELAPASEPAGLHCPFALSSCMISGSHPCALSASMCLGHLHASALCPAEKSGTCRRPSNPLFWLPSPARSRNSSAPATLTAQAPWAMSSSVSLLFRLEWCYDL